MPSSVAIVTGASQGIGRATAIRLARDFSALILVARDRAHLDETAAAVKAAGAQALVTQVGEARWGCASLTQHPTSALPGALLLGVVLVQ